MIRTLTVEYTVQGSIEIEVPDDASERKTNIIAKNALKNHLGYWSIELVDWEVYEE